MKLSTRTVSVLLAIAAAVTSFPVSALAADVEEIETASIEEAVTETDSGALIVGEDEIEFEPTVMDTETDP